MEPDQLSIALAQFLLDEWQWFIGALFGIVATFVSVSWMVAASLHNREIELLKSQIAFGESKLGQLERIMEQRIKVAEREAQKLQNRLVELGKLEAESVEGPRVLYQAPADYEIDHNEHPFFSVKEGLPEPKREERLSKLVAGISKVAEQLIRINAVS